MALNCVRRLVVGFAGLCLCMFLVARPAGAQVSTGSISGTVVDQSGAAVPGVQIIATNHANGIQAKTVSDGSGVFRLSLLPIGTYEVDFSKSGFSTLKNGNVQVSVNADHGLGQVRLALGAQSTTVEVTSSAPLIESTQAQITQTFSSSEVSTFAGISEGEGLDNMAVTLPGVSMARSDSFSNSNGPDFTVNGLRSRNNDQQIDGQNNNDNSVAGPSLFLINPDFVQEYNITTNNFSPEYGRNSGSAVNEITKSGTNLWHGDVMGNETNSVMDALTNEQIFFEGLTKVPRFNTEFTGGTIGGPVWKNHVFLFGGFDDEITGQTSVATGGNTPTPTGLAALEGCYPNSTSVQALAQFGAYGIGGGSPTPTAPLSTVALADAPVPNSGNACDVQVGSVTRILATPSHEYDWVYRMDAVINDQDRFYGRYLFNKSNSLGNDPGGYPEDVPDINQSFLLEETHTFSSNMVNEWRGSFSRLNVDFGGNQLGNTVPPMSQLTDALAHVAISGGYLSFGPATNLPQGRIVNTWQTQDNWNLLQGKNQWKAGVNFTYQRSPNNFLPDVNGAYTFSGFTNNGSGAFASAGGCSIPAGASVTSLGAFACDIPSAIAVASGNANLDFREYDTFLYGGDDLKLKKNLTLNLGLTWSYYGQPANLFHTLTTKQQTGSTPFWNPALPLSVTTSPTIPAPKTSFGPGVGFAWSPTWGGWLTGGSQSKTVLRGGYRLSYDPPFYNIYLNMSSSAPNVLLQSLTGATANNTPLIADPTGPNVRAQLASELTLGVFDPRQFNQTQVSPDFGPDRVHEWSFGIQRQLSSQAVLEVRYVGNHALDGFQTIDGNPLVCSGFDASGNCIAGLQAEFPSLVPSGVTGCTPANAVVPTAVGRENCNEGVVRERTNTSYSNYEGLQTEFRTTALFHQLTMRANYSWSKDLDNASEIFDTGSAGNTAAYSQDPFNYSNAEYGISGLNFPQTFAMTAWEDVPFMRTQHGVIGHILGGWAASWTYILQSGQPYTPVQFGLNSESGGDVWDEPWLAGFFGVLESARPFVGNISAPATSVGAYAGDACSILGVACSLAPNTLIDFGAANSAGTVTQVANNQVRFIVNGKEADSVFGTPFGNAARNLVSDAKTNSANISIYKNIRFNERATLQWHMTMLDAFNHPNFFSIDPFLDDAGLQFDGTGFGNIQVQPASSRSIWFGLKVTF